MVVLLILGVPCRRSDRGHKETCIGGGGNNAQDRRPYLICFGHYDRPESVRKGGYLVRLGMRKDGSSLDYA